MRGTVRKISIPRRFVIDLMHASIRVPFVSLRRSFDIRQFHDAALLSGAMPLTVLESVVDQYAASVALTGSGQVYLDFYNGQQDVDGSTVTLSSTPVTVTVDTTIPTGSIGAPQFQVRTPST